MQRAIYPSLMDKVAVVTGGGSGVGVAIVRGVVGQGSRVGFLHIDPEVSQNLVATLGPAAAVHYEYCDLKDIEQSKRNLATW